MKVNFPRALSLSISPSERSFIKVLAWILLSVLINGSRVLVIHSIVFSVQHWNTGNGTGIRLVLTSIAAIQAIIPYYSHDDNYYRGKLYKEYIRIPVLTINNLPLRILQSSSGRLSCRKKVKNCSSVMEGESSHLAPEIYIDIFG